MNVPAPDEEQISRQESREVSRIESSRIEAIAAATETNAQTVGQLQDAVSSLLQNQTILSQGQIQLNDAVVQLAQRDSQLTDTVSQLAEIQNNFDQALTELKLGQERQERLLSYLVQKEKSSNSGDAESLL